MYTILFAVLLLGSIGVVSSIVLYIVSKKFEVYEDPRITTIQGILPAANCGGCGYLGCADFAVACIKSGTTNGFRCPVGGKKVMEEIALVLSPSNTEGKIIRATVETNA
jgi:Na+-translocating ferredoxin:NAD+ oxidoreductase RNF subunit RnfB